MQLLLPRIVGQFLLRSSRRSFSLNIIDAITSTSLKMSDNESSVSPSTDRQRFIRYDLYRGHPNMNLLPHSEMKSIMSAMINNDDEDDSWTKYLNYGANAGDKRLRMALRSFLERRTCDDDWGGDSNKEAAIHDGCEHKLFITNGVSHGLELICATCTRPGDEVWVERPTYFLAPAIFQSNGLIVKALPMMSDRRDENEDIGCIDIDRLVYRVDVEGVKPPKLMYIIPSYHNPTGRTMTWKERERLASFALRHGVILVADEVYHLLDWNTKRQDPLNLTDLEPRRPCGMVHFNSLLRNESVVLPSADRIGCCVSVSSFTKIWAPGIRLGWIDAPSFIIQRLKQYGYINSQGGVAPFMGRIMTHAIESNLLDAYLDKLKLEYGERCELMCCILKQEPRISLLSHNNSPVKRQGGYFIWLQFPSGISSEDFLTYAIENYGVKFMPGGKCDPFAEEDDSSRCGRSIRSCARLCFADLDREELASATSTFLLAFSSYMLLSLVKPGSPTL